MRGRNVGSKSKLSAWIPKQIHKDAKIFATAREIDLQDLVALALQDYLADSEQHPGLGTKHIQPGGSRRGTESNIDG
jgi:hypothetical protein